MLITISFMQKGQWNMENTIVHHIEMKEACQAHLNQQESSNLTPLNRAQKSLLPPQETDWRWVQAIWKLTIRWRPSHLNENGKLILSYISFSLINKYMSIKILISMAWRDNPVVHQSLVGPFCPTYKNGPHIQWTSP